jgi:hypothetical protein
MKKLRNSYLDACMNQEPKTPAQPADVVVLDDNLDGDTQDITPPVTPESTTPEGQNTPGEGEGTKGEGQGAESLEEKYPEGGETIIKNEEPSPSLTSSETPPCQS